MESIEQLGHRAEALNQSVATWNSWMLVSLAAAAPVVPAVLITTRVALVKPKLLGETQSELIRAKDENLARDLREKDLRIAEASERANAAVLELEKLKSPRSFCVTRRSRSRACFGDDHQADNAAGHGGCETKTIENLREVS